MLISTLLLVASIPSPLLAGTEAGEPAPETESLEIESTTTPSPTPEPSATPEPTPTAAPEPTATLAPTLEPTAVPTATEVPTPIPTATLAPTETPSPTESATPTATPEPTVIPEPTVEVEETVDDLLSVLSNADFGVMSVTTAPTCTEVPLTGAGAGEDAVRFNCQGIQGQAGVAYSVATTFVTVGWEYRYPSQEAPWRGMSQSGLVTFTGTSPNFTVDLRPKEDNAAYLGEVTFEVTQSDGGGTPFTFTLDSTDPGVDPVRCTPTIIASSLAFPPSTFTNGAYLPVDGTLTLTVGSAGAACAGLPAGETIGVKSDGLNGPGDAVIPPSAITFLGAGTGLPTELLEPSGTLSLTSTQQTIATTLDTDDSGGDWPAPFRLSPPANATVGGYSGTIVITLGDGQ